MASSIESLTASNEELKEQVRLLISEVSSLKSLSSDAQGSTDGSNNSSILLDPNMVSDDLPDEEGLKLDTYLRRLSKDLSDTKVAMFDGTGWLTWEKIVRQDLTPLRVMKILTELKTPSFIKQMTPYEKQKHILTDMKLSNYLLVRLSAVPKRAVGRPKTAYLVWQKLTKLYASTSKMTQMRMRDEWALLAQKPDQSLGEWVQTVDYLAEEMESALISMDDDVKLHRLLRGLNADWDHERKHFELTKTTYEELCLTLYEIGDRKEQANTNRQLVPAFQARPDLGGSNRQPYRPLSIKGKIPRVGGLRCYTCGKTGHVQDSCPTGLKPTRGEDGRTIPRCFGCLKEGHVSNECPQKSARKKSLGWESRALVTLAESKPSLREDDSIDEEA
jgi:hypothetical protein